MFAPLFDLSSFTLRKYKKGEVIKNEGDVCISIGLLLSGSISIINTNFENKEFLINSLHEGDMFGENLIFLTNNHFPGSIICDQNSTIAFINKSNFVKLLQEDVIFLNYYLNYISNTFVTIQNRLKILNQPSIKDKFLFYIKCELSRSNNNYVVIKSQTHLAKYLNIPRPSLSRVINSLIKKGVIVKNKNIYKIKA